MAPKAKAKSAQAKKKPAEEPRLGFLPPRLLASIFLYTVTMGVLYKMADDNGTLALLKSHLQAAPWNPLSPPCGLLSAKEFVIMSDRVVVGGSKGEAVGPQPGAGKLRPMPTRRHHPRCRRRLADSRLPWPVLHLLHLAILTS